jgi:hypothetical protein
MWGKSLGIGQILWINNLARETNMRHGTWNVRSLYRTGSLMAVANNYQNIS